MGFREAVLLGLVLLLSGGTLCAATQNLSTNEPPTRTPQDHVTSGLLQVADRGSNRTEHGGLLRAPATYRLKAYQLRTRVPAVGTPVPPQPLEEQMHTTQSPAWWEGGGLSLEQLEPEVPELSPRSSKPTREFVLIQGPDLNPPVELDSAVQTLMFEQQAPVPADTVVAFCGEGEVTVEVKQNFLGNGQLIHPSDLTLGGCAALGTAHNIVRFQSELQDCGCTLRMTEEALIYSFSLMYSPTPIGNTFILKTNPATVLIECHYLRRMLVSSGAVRPTWQPFLSSMLSEQRLHFSLRLMTEDWQSQRPSGSYRLNDVMHIEAAVLQGHHVPLRVYVDSCVATVSSDLSSLPRYPFISNHGCLSDAKLKGAKSYFLQRSQEDKLHFQLRAFRFNHEQKNSLHITCRLKATKASVPIDSQHKACSFLSEANRWVASGGDNKVCGCCETSCSAPRQKRGLAADVDLQWEGTVSVEGSPVPQEGSPVPQEGSPVPQEGSPVPQEGSPVPQEGSPVPQEGSPVPQEELTVHSVLQMHQMTRAASYPATALLCGGATLTAMLLVVMGAIIRSRRHKPTAHSVGT